ncbi:MAG: acetyl-CoA C-acyltransferase [Acidobacteriota bacterium]
MSQNRVAIIAGCRTPFMKASGAFQHMTALDLGKACVRELVNRTDINVKEIGEIVYGTAIGKPSTPNIAREIGLTIGIPKSVPAHTVQMACATGVRAIASAAASVALGHAHIAIAGGAESLSDTPIMVSEPFRRIVMEANGKKTQEEKMYTMMQVKLQDMLPVPISISEPYTGLTMGEHCELMNREWGVTREEQDDYAYRSHLLASRALADGRLKAEIATVFPATDYKAVSEDDIIRRDPDRAKIASLKPAFDKQFGTITPANSSPLTDGASAVLLMSEERARALGYRPLGYIKTYAFAGLDPDAGLLLGPAYATAKALAQAQLSLKEMDLVDMHEAFAGQVLCNLRAFASRKFAEERLDRSEAIGEVDMERFNVCGGSISVGHPFGATGARILTTLANEMNRRNSQYGLLTVCAGGALGATLIVER